MDDTILFQGLKFFKDEASLDHISNECSETSNEEENILTDEEKIVCAL